MRSSYDGSCSSILYLGAEIRRTTFFLFGHQQIEETPIINYRPVKRIITSRQDYNPPVKDYNALQRNISAYQFRKSGSILWDGLLIKNMFLFVLILLISTLFLVLI